MLEREAASNRQLYETLMRREKELQVLANSRGNNVRLVEHAAPPGAPATPDLRRNFTLGLLAAFLAACVVLFLLDYLDDTIKVADDITRKLGLPCLGLVPALKSSAEYPLRAAQRSGQFGEAIRSLRTSISFSHTATGPGILMVTSRARRPRRAIWPLRWRMAGPGCCSSTRTCAGPASARRSVSSQEPDWQGSSPMAYRSRRR
jgi:hypothetical protein